MVYKETGRTLWRVDSYDERGRRVILQAFKTRKGAENAANQRRTSWPRVDVYEVPEIKREEQEEENPAEEKGENAVFTKSAAEAWEEIKRFLSDAEPGKLHLDFPGGCFCALHKDGLAVDIHTSGYDGHLTPGEARDWLFWEIADRAAAGILDGPAPQKDDAETGTPADAGTFFETESGQKALFPGMAQTERACRKESRYNVVAWCDECGTDSRGGFPTISAAKATVKRLLKQEGWESAGIYDERKKKVLYLYNAYTGHRLFSREALARSTPKYQELPTDTASKFQLAFG